MSKVTLPSEPEDERIFEQEFREADTCKVEQGMEYDPRSLAAQRWLEATVDSPATLFDEPVPWRFWKAVRRRCNLVPAVSAGVCLPLFNR